MASDAEVKALVYDFVNGREGEHARRFRTGWQAKFVCDDFKDYKVLFANGVTEVESSDASWMHGGSFLIRHEGVATARTAALPRNASVPAKIDGIPSKFSVLRQTYAAGIGRFAP